MQPLLTTVNEALLVEYALPSDSSRKSCACIRRLLPVMCEIGQQRKDQFDVEME